MDPRRMFLRRNQSKRLLKAAPAWRGVIFASLVVTVVGFVIAAHRLLAAPVQAEPTLLDLHQLPPIYGMTYSWTAAGERIQVAHEQLVSTCMARHGFAYPTASPDPTERRDEPWPFPFGLETLSQGSRPDNDVRPQEAPGSEAFTAALLGDPEQRLTARGAKLELSRPATGCLAEADERLLGDGRVRWMELTVLLHEAEQTAREWLDQDPVFRELVGRWQQCMSRAGYQANDPRQITRSLPADITAESLSVMSADIRCKDETGFLNVAYTRLAQCQQNLLDREPSLARDWWALQERQDAVARAVLKP
jgi:hypothetical protein